MGFAKSVNIDFSHIITSGDGMIKIKDLILATLSFLAKAWLFF
jgi:hypothetical protein